MIKITPPFMHFLDSDGSPLNSGSVYIGTAGANPITSPITVYWDTAATQQAAQPLRTSGGYIVGRNGAPAAVYTSSANYSMVVRDGNSQTVYTALNVSPYEQPTAKYAENIEEMKAMTSLSDGDSIVVLGYHTAGDSGGGIFKYSSGSAATSDNGTIFTPDTLAGRFLRMIEGRTIRPEFFGAKGDNSTNDYTALQATLTYAQTNVTVVLFKPNTYIAESALTFTDSFIMLKGEGLTIGSSATIIKYNGAISATTPVFELHANNTAILGGYIDGICFDANNRAGYGVTYRSTSAIMKHVEFKNSSIMNFTARGLNLVGSGSIEMSELFYDNLFIYSATTNHYGIYTSGGTNISRHVFSGCNIIGDPSGQAKNNVYLGVGSGFYFNNCLFAQTVTQSSTDGYAVYTAGGYVVLNGCWNESNGWLYHSSSDSSQATTLLSNCHIENTSTYSVFFNHATKNLVLENCNFVNDVYLGSQTAPTRVSVNHTNFASGKGVRFDYNNTGSPTLTTGFGRQQLSLESFTHTAGDARPNGMADVTSILLNANIGSFDVPPITTDKVVVIFTQGATARTVTFAAAYKRAGGGAISVTATPAAVDIFEFIGIGGGVYALVGEYKNIS